LARTHELPADAVHYRWDTRNGPVLTIASGDCVVMTTREVSDGQLTPTSDSSIVPMLDWDRFYPLAGPIAVEGAGPGDTLAIEIVGLAPGDWGWTAIIPGKGLLPVDFRDPYLRIFDLTRGDTTAFGDDTAIPGGNLDTRQLTRGTTLYLPVEEPLALFSCGDAHAAQGDGEVCVTGIEATMDEVALRFTLEKGRQIPAPQFLTAGPLTPRVDGSGFYGTTGVGPDLYGAAQDAVRAMIDRLGAERGLTPEDAYVLSSLCVDLKIVEIVDAGQYVVSALLPLAIFRQ